MESIKKQSIIEKGRFVSDVAKFKSTWITWMPKHYDW